MPSAFYSFGRDGGRRRYAAPDGQAYVELSGTAALLLVICPALSVTVDDIQLVLFCCMRPFGNSSDLYSWHPRRYFVDVMWIHYSMLVEELAAFLIVCCSMLQLQMTPARGGPVRCRAG